MQSWAAAPACKNEGEVEGHGADCSGTNGRSESSMWYVPVPDAEHQDELEMSQAEYAAVDWGTSSFRLWLIDRAGGVLQERRSQEGMMAAAKLGFAAVLQSHLDAVGAANDLAVVVCGMAGARQGWVEAGYIDTPAHLAFILERAVPVPGQSRDIRILPGIAQRDPKAPDVMRGEETQLLGALGVDAAGEAGVRMPGTQSKWGRANGGAADRLAALLAGEPCEATSRAT